MVTESREIPLKWNGEEMTDEEGNYFPPNWSEVYVDQNGCRTALVNMKLVAIVSASDSDGR